MTFFRCLTLGVSLLLTMTSLAACGSDGSAPVTPQPIPQPAVATITVSPSTVSLDAGQTKQLAVTLLDAQGRALTGRAIAFASSAPTVASVTATGLVTALAPGQATIAVTSEGRSAQAVVSVANAVASIGIAGALDTLEAYDVRTVQAVVRDANGVVMPATAISWTSSNPGVATVAAASSSGTATLTGIDRGTVTITATAGGKSATVTRAVVIKYRSISAGTMHACDLASGGIAWCWGLNGSEARLGVEQVGDNVFRTEPVQVPGGHRFSQLVTFARFTCGLRLDGKAFCWGSNEWGALGNGTDAPYSAAPTAVAGNNSFVQLAAGSEFACGLTTARTMLCWGHNDWGQFGRGNTTSSSTPVVAGGGKQFSRIAAGVDFACGIAVEGDTYCFGDSGLGQLGDGGRISYGNTFVSAPSLVSGGKSFASITLGGGFACGLTGAGQAFCWGSNNGMLGDAGGPDTSTPNAVSGGQTFAMLSAGVSHTCGVTASADVYCWGANRFGQLGNSVTYATAPVLAGSGIKASEVTTPGINTGFAGHTCAISQDRLTAWCWGLNSVGQLGNGSTSPSTTVNATPSVVKTQKPL